MADTAIVPTTTDAARPVNRTVADVYREQRQRRDEAIASCRLTRATIVQARRDGIALIPCPCCGNDVWRHCPLCDGSGVTTRKEAQRWRRGF